ncbi:DEAD/DEAH box helicase family protein [Hymenobacter aerilatus]|uniref:DEAD/DEAH box helicase family protein n=1 Tax=Hymenobacter aerilatus TaxID=2932251 RepID=A0A8T9T0N6_9BACT|nr:DEAD/DEAH box helicase family protein [Hymenobacter aerilatus]UOR07407.1 DEAD/DEAH box helicase family protein [Hymenobacter aerilatus]
MPTTPLSNFSFLEAAWPDLYEPAREAELHVWSAPRLAALSSRIALENAIRWVYDNDSSLTIPYQDNLATLLHESGFRNLIGSIQFQGGNYVRKLGNQAAHQKVSPTGPEAFDALRHLYGFLAFVAAAYSPERPRIRPFDETLLPAADASDTTQVQAQKLEADYLAQQEELARKTAQLAANAQQLAALQASLAAIQEVKAYNLAHPVAMPQAITEAETRRRYIDLLLREAGWDVTAPRVCEFEVTGIPLSTNPSGKGYADYVLWDDNGRPLAVVEAKKTMAEPTKGRYQATLYANCLEQMTGQRPIVFYTNGFENFLLDDHPATDYPPRQVAGFLTKNELRRMLLRRTSRHNLTQASINPAIAGRYYQAEAIGRVATRFQTQKQRGALLVMATGSGKTRTAAALVDVLLKAGWVTRVLFLADRKALVRQAKNAFAEHLPSLSLVNITQEKEDSNSRMVFSTYPTMMNRIDGEVAPGATRLYGPGYFDLIIVDEAHRSVYQKYQTIFEYFDSLLIGLTATPIAQIDRNTYELFGLEDHQPAYAYELNQAVQDKYLVPPKALSVPLKFQRQGIKYNELSEAKKEEYEEEFRDEATGLVPDEIGSSALNAWLFNQSTVDEVLRFVLERGVKVEGGDKLGKTILFARSHRHALFIEERFHKLFPQLGGGFVHIIDNYEEYAQALLDNFSETDKIPQLAISVDMLDTGIAISDVVNPVFFKAVRSSAKFWQMLGRGTRLRSDLFGPGQHKEHFVVFDFCENFEFFEAQPEGLIGSNQVPLSQQIFTARLTLAEVLRQPEYHTDEAHRQLRRDLLDTLHGQVAALDQDSFAVRARLRHVEEFGGPRARWEALTKVDVQNLENHLAPLAPVEGTDELARRFDLMVLNLMLAIVQKSTHQQGYIERIANLGYNLNSQKASVPAVLRQKELLQQVQQKQYWQYATLPDLEALRQNLRDLVKFLDRDQQPVVYTHFADQLDAAAVAEKDITTWGSTVLESYYQRVARYIRNNQHHLTISRLRTNQPITATELHELERLVSDGHERGTVADLHKELGQPKPLGEFIRSLLGLDVNAAKEAFAGFLSGRTLQPDQILLRQQSHRLPSPQRHHRPSEAVREPFHREAPPGRSRRVSGGNPSAGAVQDCRFGQPKRTGIGVDNA